MRLLPVRPADNEVWCHDQTCKPHCRSCGARDPVKCRSAGGRNHRRLCAVPIVQKPHLAGQGVQLRACWPTVHLSSNGEAREVWVNRSHLRMLPVTT